MDYHQLVFDAIVRDGDNLVQHLGDCVGDSGYTGEPPHHFGQPLMGAFWKLRADLKADLGELAGGKLADRLFLGWLNAFDQREIHSIIMRQLLVLDDDDRDLDDESPSWDSIEHAFALHGFAVLE
jgi:hypothetical protein